MPKYTSVTALEILFEIAAPTAAHADTFTDTALEAVWAALRALKIDVGDGITYIDTNIRHQEVME